MTALFIVTRAIHYASALVLLGELLFAVAIASSGWRDAARSAGTPSARIFRTMIWSLVIGLASVLAALGISTALAAGVALGEWGSWRVRRRRLRVRRKRP